MDFRGKAALITGAASGIGQATAQVLAERGCDIAVNDINEAGARQAAKELRGLGVRAIPVVADVADSQAVGEMVDTILRELGRIDILFANAGYDEICSLEEMTDEQWHRMIDVHLGGVFYCCRAVVSAMKQQGSGKIICTGSISGMVAWGYDNAHYCAAKAGIMGLAKSLAKELAPYKINVNVVAPGSVMTPLQSATPPEVIETRMRENPWGRFADPREIGYLVAFLASEEADYITGQVISPNGGAVIVGI
jgi:3-oxoacyl-[acyl-carrier protein] reductase